MVKSKFEKFEAKCAMRYGVNTRSSQVGFRDDSRLNTADGESRSQDCCVDLNFSIFVANSSIRLLTVGP
ncbi:hypothetical protein GOBAR_AA34660 [Gossypium barbadense]|uniref:Uncharacterized protein n=1 Tax=Gossypium barbadense TaxID=3634 RepID=A0A2P5W4Q5_GOSBA|nr:hypothetical protein GOBAR_AA34660 [Gossypium barbadense]